MTKFQALKQGLCWSEIGDNVPAGVEPTSPSFEPSVLLLHPGSSPLRRCQFLEMPPRTDASPADIARGLFNPNVDWNKVDAELDEEYAEHERKATEHEQQNP